MHNLIGVYILLTCNFVLAGESAHGETSIKELLFPVLNFGILFLFLIIKGKKPMQEMFSKNAEEVKELFNHAMGKDKQAQIKLDMYKKKMSGLESDKRRIAEEAITDSKNYSTELAKEMQLTIQKRKSDAEIKAKVERETMVQAINKDLVDEVISLTKKSIQEKTEIQKKVTSKLLESL